jgi:hypothetical protein
MKKVSQFSYRVIQAFPTNGRNTSTGHAIFKHSRQVLVLLWVAMLAWSCRSNDPQAGLSTAEDPNWIRLEIPNGWEAYAIAGDIDKTLLVTTWTKAYYTSDQGKTWQESKDFHGHVPGLFVLRDTVFSLEASGQDQTGQPYASLARYFTADYGRTWQSIAQRYTTHVGYDFYSQLSLPVGVVKTADGIIYRIKQNGTPVEPGSTSLYTNPSELQKEDRFGVQTLRLPFAHKMYNLHLDAGNRLYITASGGTFDQNNRLYCCENKTPAIVYVSRKPLP